MRLSNNRLLVAAIAFTFIFALAACESDADRIRSINEADRTQTASGTSTPTPTPLSAEIASVDIQDGDCIDSTIEQRVTIESVVIVPCSGSWQYRVVSSFTVADFPQYPGEDHFGQLALEQCDRRSTDFLHPTSESWALKDRTISCLQKSFGLSGNDQANLERLVSASRLDVGDCYNEAPQTGGLMVELVACSGDWEYRVLSSFTVADSPEYPGEDHFGLLAGEQCDRRFTFLLYPTSELWALGDRTLSCLQESFGLSTNDPPKLDRLVGLDRLKVGECYNEAPETGHLLVEVVECSGDWELQVVDVFSVPPGDAFPGDAYFQDQANADCPEPWTYFYSPNNQSWALGDREVICVRTP